MKPKEIHLTRRKGQTAQEALAEAMKQLVVQIPQNLDQLTADDTPKTNPPVGNDKQK